MYIFHNIHMFIVCFLFGLFHKEFSALQLAGAERESL